MSRRRVYHAALAVAIAFSMSSCESADILQPTDAAPQFNQGNGNGPHKAPGQQKKLWDALNASVSNAGASDIDDFDRAGGELYVSAETDRGIFDFSLVVPRNAVRSLTTFTMRVADGDGVIGVDLTAENAAGEDVGARGFNRPVTLCLDVTGLVDETRTLGLALDEAGEFFPIPTYQFTNPYGNDYLCGDLHHFSRFIIIHN